MNRLTAWLRKLLVYPARLGRMLGLHGRVIILMPVKDEDLLADISYRITFYTLGAPHRVNVKRRLPLLQMLLGVPTLCFQQGNMGRICRLFPHTYAVDHRAEIAGWEWTRFAADFTGHKVDRQQARQNLFTALQRYRGLNHSYVFGTGPSLARANDQDWSDGFRIVCNTIVRDGSLIAHIRPHIVVAGDAVYHFSHTPFAKRFREDLQARLAEQQGMFFAYPETFDVIVRNEFTQYTERLIPIPTGGAARLDVNLATDFTLPSLGNVLALLLLPVAFTYSRRVKMIGFDGRDPQDNVSPFWANSARHAYPELMWTLKDQFPAFFQIFAPNNDSRRYIQVVHEDLEALLREAEARGGVIEMLHPSWTESLHRRYSGSLSREQYYYGDIDNG